MTQPIDLRRLSLDALHRRRARLLDKIDTLDDELRRRGVPVAGRRPGELGPSADILAELAKESPLTPAAIAQRTGREQHPVRVACSRLAKASRIKRVGHGLYARLEAPKPKKARTP